MTQSTFTLYVGGQYDRHGVAIPSRVSFSAIMEAMREATNIFGGTTILLGWGGYLSPTGEHVMEKSARIEIVTDSSRKAEVHGLAINLGYMLDTETVLVTETRLDDVAWLKPTPSTIS